MRATTACSRATAARQQTFSGTCGESKTRNLNAAMNRSRRMCDAVYRHSEAACIKSNEVSQLLHEDFLMSHTQAPLHPYDSISFDLRSNKTRKWHQHISLTRVSDTLTTTLGNGGVQRQMNAVTAYSFLSAGLLIIRRRNLYRSVVRSVTFLLRYTNFDPRHHTAP